MVGLDRKVIIMQCKNCGSNLVRGFSFCLECGLPVPDELLEESGLPQRNIDSSPQEVNNAAAPEHEGADSHTENEDPGDLKPQLHGGDQDRGAALKPQFIGGDTGIGGKDLKPKYIGDDSNEKVKDEHQVKVVLQETSNEGDTVTEKLVFCPNCGMRMQHNPHVCEICGMLLGNKPTNVPTTTAGVPLFNTDGNPFSGGLEGFGGFSGGVPEIPNSPATNTENVLGGNNIDPMFNKNAQTGDLASLTEQLAGFSAAAETRTIGVTENTRVRQAEPEKGMEREVSDFSMIDDLSSESVPISDSNVPVVGDYSMDENPDEFIDLDPYHFLNTSMDENAPEPAPKKAPEPMARQSAFVQQAPPKSAEPVVPNITNTARSEPEPIVPNIANSTPEPGSVGSPFIEEQSPVISESAPVMPAFGGLGNKMPASPAPAAENTAPEQPVPDIVQQPQQAAPAARPAPQTVQTPAAPKAAASEATKKCYACGHIMPAADKFCPNCGRSTFGAPNPNLVNHANYQPNAPKSNKALPIILAAIVVVIIAVVAIIALKGNAAGLDDESFAAGENTSSVTIIEETGGTYTEIVRP